MAARGLSPEFMIKGQRYQRLDALPEDSRKHGGFTPPQHAQRRVCHYGVGGGFWNVTARATPWAEAQRAAYEIGRERSDWPGGFLPPYIGLARSLS